MSQKNLQAGLYGESLALRFLEHLGYVIWHRNVRIGRDEIDLIAFDPQDGTLVFAEVKTRRRTTPYDPSLNLTLHKRRCMRRAAESWVTTHQFEGPWRIDALCISGATCVHTIACHCPATQLV